MKYDFNEKIDRHGTYSTQWDFIADRFGTNNVIPFTISDSDFAVPQEIQSALHKRIDKQIFGYTRWNHDDFKHAIMYWFRARFDTRVNPEYIVYGPSVMYMIKTILVLLMKNKDVDYLNVALQDPGYDGFKKMLRGMRHNIIHWNSQIDATLFDFEQLCKTTNIDVFILCHPHNPTGSELSRKYLIKLFELCKKYNIFIISDEIHMDFVYAPIKHTPALQVAEQVGIQGQFVLVTSASKTFNTAGLQGAYMFVPNEDLREQYLFHLKNIDCLSSASIMGMEALMAGYTYGSDWLVEMKTYLSYTFRWIENFIEQEQLPIYFEHPKATYFAWLDMRDFGLTEEALQQELLAEGVAIMAGSYYLMHEGNYLRINISAPRKKIFVAFYALRNIYTRIKNDTFSNKNRAKN